MTLVRLLARPMLGSFFLLEGVKAVRHPEPLVDRAAPLIAKVTPLLNQYAPQLPNDPTTIVRANGAVQLGAGLALSLGKAPRLAALLLAASEAASTLAEHRFWECKDIDEKKRERAEFLHGVSLVGGLLLAGVDTEGRPGLPWRARRAAKDARRAAKTAKREARLAARTARAEVTRGASSLVH